MTSKKREEVIMKKRVKYIALLLVSLVFILSACTPFDFNGLLGGKTATVGGIVKDATTGLPLSGVTVKSGNISETTDSEGKYVLYKVPIANTSISASKSGYVTNTQTLSLVADEQKTVDFVLSPELAQDEELRIVLTWGESPRDLDSHLLVPADASHLNGYEVYYRTRGINDPEQYPYAYLDVDDITSYGPETITVFDTLNHTYKYYVHNYSGEAEITTSNAKVEVYGRSGLLRTYNIPTSGNGRYWYVFDIDASGGIINRNVIQGEAPELEPTL